MFFLSSKKIPQLGPPFWDIAKSFPGKKDLLFWDTDWPSIVLPSCYYKMSTLVLKSFSSVDSSVVKGTFLLEYPSPDYSTSTILKAQHNTIHTLNDREKKDFMNAQNHLSKLSQKKFKMTYSNSGRSSWWYYHYLNCWKELKTEGNSVMHDHVSEFY